MKFSKFARNMLKQTYIHNDETVEERFSTISKLFSSDKQHQERLLHYLENQWLIPSSPVLFNSTKELVDMLTIGSEFQYRQYHLLGTVRNQPISCFSQYIPDTLEGIINTSSESKYLSTGGGGYSKIYSDVRSITDKSPGVIKLLAEDDRTVLAFYQGKSRRAAMAGYLHYTHPEILQFITGRDPTGGDINQKFLNLHHGVTFDNKFLELISNNEVVELRQPHNNELVDTISARDLWFKLLQLRHKTGEPYLMNLDTTNNALPKTQCALGLSVKGSNLCSEITLPTNEDRTFVCNIMNLNLALFEEWEKDTQFIFDVVHAMDNVAEFFIQTAHKKHYSKAIYSAQQERALALGVIGFHSYLQKNSIPYTSVMAKVHNVSMFKHIHTQAINASVMLGTLYGECPDMLGTGRRNSHVISHPPTASTSQILGESPSTEVLKSNAYAQRTQTGTNLVKNKYLKAILKDLGKNTKEVWESITSNNGSVTHLDFLDEWTKEVFKTAKEVDQHYVVQHAIDRQPYVCQAQSVNLDFPPEVSIEYLHSVHWKAMSQGLKTLYYLRTGNKQQNVTSEIKQTKDFITDPTECLFCQ